MPQTSGCVYRWQWDSIGNHKRQATFRPGRYAHERNVPTGGWNSQEWPIRVALHWIVGRVYTRLPLGGSLSSLPGTLTAGTSSSGDGSRVTKLVKVVNELEPEGCGCEYSRSWSGCVPVKFDVRPGNLHPFQAKRQTIFRMSCNSSSLILGTRKSMVIKRPHDGVRSRWGACYNIVLFWDMFWSQYKFVQLTPGDGTVVASIYFCVVGKHKWEAFDP